MVDEDETSPLIKIGLAWAAVAIVVLLAKGLLLTAVGWSLGSFLDLARYSTVSAWPVHRGYVEEWGTRYDGDGAYSSWAVFLYESEGEVYKGWCPNISRLQYPSDHAAKKALTPFPVGQELRVSVNPLNPTDAVLDPANKSWMPLAIRLAVACLLMAMTGVVLSAFGAPAYAVALALCAMIGLGGLCHTMANGPMAQRAGINPSQLWERYSRIADLRTTWLKLKPGDLVSSAPAIGEPDRVTASDGGTQTWVFDHGPGTETSGKLKVMPSTKGWVVDQAFPPYETAAAKAAAAR